MKRTKLTRMILLLVLVTTAIGAGYAYKEYNRKRPSAANMNADFSDDIGTFTKAFTTNLEAANKKYLNKIISIKSVVHGIEKDELGLYTIIFRDSISNTSIRCLMDSAFNQQAATIQPTMQVQLNGTCTGYQPDDMGLGADIILQRTVIH